MAKGTITSEKIRQGQTIYMVFRDWCSARGKPLFRSYFLYSQKTPLPVEGSIIDKLPVTHLRKCIRDGRGQGVYFSKKKAITELKRLERQYGYDNARFNP
jgi:hypothetical protein